MKANLLIAIFFFFPTEVDELLVTDTNILLKRHLPYVSLLRTELYQLNPSLIPNEVADSGVLSLLRKLENIATCLFSS